MKIVSLEFQGKKNNSVHLLGFLVQSDVSWHKAFHFVLQALVWIHVNSKMGSLK